ncbi:unnamed protein product [Pleuronectes platessa]|uniref:Uncharacterized protein n=1 Tax=Pleuronectes platessa TaxID=8262 RepID=A0A9N7VWE8_PLEPL|nr:unnamed protein product [Pleuronectes platessa]
MCVCDAGFIVELQSSCCCCCRPPTLCGLFTKVSPSACQQTIVPTAAGRTPDDTRALHNRPKPVRPSPLPPPALEAHRHLLPALADPHLQGAADGAAWLRRHLQPRQWPLCADRWS